MPAPASHSIGELSRRTGVKVTTIRFYESRGLMPDPGRTAGGQRRYDDDALARLGFIAHARQLGFDLDAIAALISLQDHPDRSCGEARRVAEAQRRDVREKLARLASLDRELTRILDGCDGDAPARDCYVLASLADHGMCAAEH